MRTETRWPRKQGSDGSPPRTDRRRSRSRAARRRSSRGCSDEALIGRPMVKASRGVSWRTRQLCSESDEHHERVWFCMTCKALEQRLAPVSETLAELLQSADLSVTITRWPR